MAVSDHSRAGVSALPPPRLSPSALSPDVPARPLSGSRPRQILAGALPQQRPLRVTVLTPAGGFFLTVCGTENCVLSFRNKDAS